MTFILDTSKTLQVQVYEYMHDKIVNGKLGPGTRVVEQQIAEETGVSRSPIREAIKQLKSEALVASHPRGGVRVFRPTSDDFKYLYECRLSLEPLAASLAAERSNNIQLTEINELLRKMKDIMEAEDFEHMKKLSRNFHDLILECSENPFLIKMMNQLHSLILFYRNIILTKTSRMVEGFFEHEAICFDILNRDAKSAEKHMRDHIQKDYNYYLEQYGYN
ncbi:GntR family transcriptional regulator [Oceanobacillus sp. FSL K6-0127]|uniref:GntR family transcriptional regulator n=1 Tax=Oceanobacillus sp. FSL K6-0127 TaxID=2921420 RepID=UPI0030EE019E